MESHREAQQRAFSRCFFSGHLGGTVVIDDVNGQPARQLLGPPSPISPACRPPLLRHRNNSTCGKRCILQAQEQRETLPYGGA